MLLGQSLFQSVIDRLATEAAEREIDGDGKDGVMRRRPGLPGDLLAGLDQDDHAAPDGHPGQATGFDATGAYLELADDEQALSAKEAEEVKETPMPDHLARLTREEIARDLGIEDGDTPARLAEKRRAFARLNHPDRLPAAYRQQATLRMTIANALVDTALHAAKRREA